MINQAVSTVISAKHVKSVAHRHAPANQLLNTPDQETVYQQLTRELSCLLNQSLSAGEQQLQLQFIKNHLGQSGQAPQNVYIAGYALCLCLNAPDTKYGNLGQNLPSKTDARTFFTHLATVCKAPIAHHELLTFTYICLSLNKNTTKELEAWREVLFSQINSHKKTTATKQLPNKKISKMTATASHSLGKLCFGFGIAVTSLYASLSYCL